ncbi:MAG: hypothetical protein ACHRXM_02625 [Isosphaerales bacterium]
MNQKIREILQHTSPMPVESTCPIRHLDRAANSIAALLKYLDIHLEAAGFYESVCEKHMAHLRRMALASLIESFERFLKELASVYIDTLVSYVGDDRFDEFSAKGSQLAFHLSAGSVGKALCESDTWLTNKTINERFRRLLKSPFGDNWENLFPEENQPPQSERARAKTLSILWQIRHTITHNVGVITGSDAAKLRMMVKGEVAPDRIVDPARHDLLYTMRFLLDAAQSVNQRVGKRLEILLDGFHRDNPALFDAQEMADRVSRQLGVLIIINGSTGAL